MAINQVSEEEQKEIKPSKKRHFSKNQAETDNLEAGFRSMDPSLDLLPQACKKEIWTATSE